MKINEKHLEFVQNNITRMSQCSFQMKGWSLTIDSALIAIFVSTISNENVGNRFYMLSAIITTFLFWCLDSMYLSKERKFIGIYNDLIGVSNGKKRKHIEIREFEMPLKKYKGWKYCIIASAISPSEILFYGSIIIGLVIFYKVI